jgi:peptidoglycan hydrolase-like protein with peptidoglycan-binding domain
VEIVTASKTAALATWLQTCLRDLVAPDLVVDGDPGARTTAALKKFQGAHGLRADGVAGPATIAALEAASNTTAPGSKPKPAAAAVAPAATPAATPAAAPAVAVAAAAAPTPQPGDYQERRVRVRTYGTTASSSALLVPVASTSGSTKRLHVLAAQAMAALAAAVQRDLGIVLKIASGWRAHRWTSKEQYEATLIAKFGSVKEGKRWLGFDSPHETGLAMDIGVGLKPSRATVDFQRKTPLHQWLVKYAGTFGWHPYKTEPWHWEYPMSLEAFASGVVDPDDPGPPEDELSFDIDGEVDALEDEDLEEFPDDELAEPEPDPE